jgi:hypothetical protein
LFTACKEAKKEEKEMQQQVLDVHEKVMNDDEAAMHNKMKLDTLMHKMDSLKTDKQEAVKLSTELTKASDAMSNWMSNFNPDYSGKNHDDIMKYLEGQREQVKQVDSMLINATKASSDYLQKNNLK